MFPASAEPVASQCGCGKEPVPQLVVRHRLQADRRGVLKSPSTRAKASCSEYFADSLTLAIHDYAEAIWR